MPGFRAVLKKVRPPIKYWPPNLKNLAVTEQKTPVAHRKSVRTSLLAI